VSGSWAGTSPPLPVTRAAPDVPNVVSGTVTPLPARQAPPPSRTTVRLSPPAAAALSELPRRLDNYRQLIASVPRPLWAPRQARTVTFDEETRFYVQQEAKANRMTINTFIEHLLTDSRLHPGNTPQPPPSAPPPQTFILPPGNTGNTLATGNFTFNFPSSTE
jgi:hypothetical protein